MKTVPVSISTYNPNIINFHLNVIERLQDNKSFLQVEPLLEILNKKLWEYIPRRIWSDQEFTRVVNEVITELKSWRRRNPLNVLNESKTDFSDQLKEEARHTHGFQSMLISFESLLEDIGINGWTDELCNYAGYKSQRDE